MRESYAGISLLPFHGGSYKQAPYTTCTEAEYEELERKLSACQVDLREVSYAQGQDDMASTAACEGGLCSIEIPARNV